MGLFNGIHLNPFALDTAKREWEANEQKLSQRVLGTCTSAVYDIFVKNPYDISIKNAKNIFVIHRRDFTNIQKVAGAAIILLGSFYTLMLYGGTIWLSGANIAALGTTVGSIRLKSVGLVIQTIGEKIFLTGAVPTYGLCFLLPKKIPVIAKFVEKTIANIFRTFRDKLWVPCLKKGIKGVTWTGERLEKVHQALKTILTPFRNKVLVPCLQKSIKGVAWTVEQLYKVHRFLRTKALVPCLKKSIKATARMMERLEKAHNGLVKLITSMFRNSVLPLWNNVMKPTARFVVKVIRPPIKILAAKIERAAYLVWVNVLSPPLFFVSKKVVVIVNAISESFYILTNKVATIWDHLFPAHSLL